MCNPSLICNKKSPPKPKKTFPSLQKKTKRKPTTKNHGSPGTHPRVSPTLRPEVASSTRRPMIRTILVEGIHDVCKLKKKTTQKRNVTLKLLLWVDGWLEWHPKKTY